MNILVLCTGNSARSILLEALLNDLSDDRVKAFSAGSQPAGKVHVQSLALLSAHGHATDAYRSKSWNEFAGEDAPEMDAVITVCGSAASEVCPIWRGAPVDAHWGVDDPAAAPEHEAPAAFALAYAILRRRAVAFLDKPVEDMHAAALKSHLDLCGAIT